MKRILLVSFLLVSFISSEILAQERSVSGKITSAEDGSGIPGVNVVVKGSTTGTVSDIDGNFKINVPSSGGILVFSFIGLQTQEVEIGNQSVIDVAMKSDVQQLSEVVVTAIGIEREKKALGYAVTDLSADEVQQKSEPDVVRALQGKVPGVNIIGASGVAGSATNITIRGNNSLLGNNQPLMVVDGVPFDNTVYATGSFTSGGTASGRAGDIDPNNIESITVLKGAAASSLYGARGSNGVIVITTKAGRKASRKGLEVNVNLGYSWENVANLPDYQQTYTQGNNFLYVDGNFGTWGAPFDINTDPWQVSNNSDLIFSVDPATGRPWVAHPYDRYSNPAGSPFFPEFVGDSVLLQPFNTPEDYFETGHLFEGSVSITGGDAKANYTAGISRTSNNGFVRRNRVDRTTVNIAGNVKLDNGLTLQGNINYVVNDMATPPAAGLSTGGPSIMERLLYTPPNVNAAGLPFEDANGAQAWYRPDNDNPYYLTRYAPLTTDVDRWFGSLAFGYDITDWINITYRIGFNGFTQNTLEVYPATTNNDPQGRILSDRVDRQELNGDLLLTLTRDLTEDINLKAIIGHNANKRTVNRQAFQGTGIIVPRIDDMDNTTNVIPFGGGLEEQSYQAVFADLTFSYRDWAYLTLTGRNDWTSTLPEDERSYFYGSVGASVILTDALNMNSNVLNFAKVRASWGRVGSDIFPYLTQEINFFTNTSIGNNIAAMDFPFNGAVNAQNIGNTLGNPELTPEFTREWEIGTDLRFFQDRIKLDFTYYDKSTTDQIVQATIPSSTGFGAYWTNIGEVTNKGIEIALGLTPIRTNWGFTWEIFGTFTRNRNEVVELTEGIDELFVNGFGNAVRIVHIEGEEYGQIKGSVAARDAEGNLLIDPGTGKLITSLDEQVIGNPNPDYITSITNTFSWKGISLSALLDYRHGGDMYSDTYAQVYGRGLTPGTIPDNPRGREVTVVIPGVLGDPTTQEPILDDQGQTITNGTQLTVNDWYFINTFGTAGPEEFTVFDQSVIRLREVSVGYSLPQSVLEKTPFGGISIILSGRNLWYNAPNFPDDLNFDPETSSLGAGNVNGLSQFNTGNAQGVDFGIVPTTRRFGINVNLKF